MRKVVLILPAVLVAALIWMIAVAAGLDQSITSVPIERLQTLNYQPDRAACSLTRSSFTATSYYGLYQAGMQTVTYFDPTGFCAAPVYPFEVEDFSFTLYGFSGAVWPVTVDVVVYEAADSCAGPGVEKCRMTIVADQATYGYPTVGTATFPTPCCVNGPFYIGLEYVTGVSGSTPSILFDDNPPVDTCVHWFYYSPSFIWVEWYDLWTPPAPGNPMFWVDGETDSPNCPSGCTWNPGDPHKMHFPQLPDEAGWDVNATQPLVLADDFLCTETGYIRDVHFWGSWRNGTVGEIMYFVLSFHEDIPADQNPDGYSKPGTTLWEWEVPIDWVNITPKDPPTAEGWYDPSTGEVIYDDHQAYFQYDICLDQFLPVDLLFYQIEDSIYWLNISAVLMDPSMTQWGWKSSVDHWMDDAVWAYWGDLDWKELYEPGSADPITNHFWIEFDAFGMPVPPTTGGTDYYDDGTSLNGWYFYPNTGWWNIWFYDHPFDPTRYKEIMITFDWFPTAEPHFIEVAANWATPFWPPGGPPPIPPLDPGQEDSVIHREYLPIMGPGTQEFYITVPDYNPEWVSIDVMGQNVIIPQGITIHQCLPQEQVSMDLAFVITGGEECSPSIEVEKTVRDDATGEWVKHVDVNVGLDVEFQIAVHNNGTCCDLTDIVIVDTLDNSLAYLGAVPPPDFINQIPEGTELTWLVPGPLPVCNWLYFYIQAQVLGPVCHTDTNYVFVEGFCEATSEYAQDADFATVHATQPPLDFGDLPAPYPTLLANDGARHTIVPNVFLGFFIDSEPDGQPSIDALGDDKNPAALPDDEDGVVFTTLVVQGQAATVKVIASTAGYLNAWADWNKDGDFDDYAEQIFTDQPLSAGVNWLTVIVPSNAYIGETYSRWRFNTTGGLTYFGPADDGEVEDYRLFITEPISEGDIKMHWPQWPDLDNTGMDVDMHNVELADDFLCTQNGPITDIHFWGSFADDVVPPEGPGSLVFLITIYADIPAGVNPDGPWSKPGPILWQRIFMPGMYNAYQVTDNNPEDWFDPVSYMWINDNHLNCYQFDFYIDEAEAFIQQEGAIYWLGIKDLPDVPGYMFGWKTTEFPLRWNDNATALIGPPTYWLPLYYPPGHEFMEQSLDLAFVITGGEAYICGDVDKSGAVDIDDVVYLINFIFAGGPPPDPLASGDVNCSGGPTPVDIDDVVYLINYIFAGGPAPCDPDGDGIPDC